MELFNLFINLKNVSMKRITSILVFLVFIGCLAFSQEVQITGTITSAEDGSVLPGVSVLVKGTQKGTTTDVDGKYKIAVTPDATLVFDFVGMQSQEVAVGQQTVINLAMESETLAVNEVVVTAIGIQRSVKSLGYSVTSVSSDKANVKSEPDMLKALQGKVPGVDIKVSQGAPGSATKINIRGNSSFYGSNQALIVVDGVPYSNDQVTTSDQTQGNGGAYSNGLSTLDPNSIESISVLKGSAAAALYGSRAANGVLIVKTKSGKTSQSKRGMEVTYNTSFAWETIANLPDYQNTYGNGSNFTYANSNGSWGPRFDSQDSIPVWPVYLATFPELFPASGNIEYKAQPDNVKSLFKTGQIFENSLSVAGGDEKNSFSATVSSMNQDGYIPNSSFDRYGISVGGSSKLTNGLIVGGNLSYTKTNQIGGFFGENQFDGAASSFARSLFLGRTWDMSLPYEDPATGYPVSTNPAQYDNPLWSNEHNTNTTLTDRTVAGINLSYNITNWLTVSYQLGTNNIALNRKEVTDIGSRAAAGTGQIIEDNFNKRELESNFLVTLGHSLGTDFSLKAVLGHNVNQQTTNRQAYKGNIIISPGIYDIDNTQNVIPWGGIYSQRRLWALFGDVSLGYKDWAYLTLTGRNDWSSTLPEENNSYFYPAISGSFVFTEALGIPDNILNFGKIRASYAMVGNDADPYSLSNVYELSDPFLGQPTITTPNTGNNPSLKPEMVKETELGTELQFFNSRIGLDFTWYNKISTDMIAPVPVPASSGFEYAYMNFGEMRNRGVEIGLDLVPVKTTGGFTWDLYASFTKNKNKVLSLMEGVDRLAIDNLGIEGLTPTIEPDYAYGVFRGSYALRDSASGALIIDPITGFPYLASDEKVIGDPNPDFNLGLTNTFSYKGITLSFLFDWKQGGDIYSVTISSLLGRGVTKDTEERETSVIIPGVYGDNQGTVYKDNLGNPITNRTSIVVNDLYFYPGGNETTFAINGAGEYQIYDGTVYRLRELSIGYDLPKKWIEKIKIGRINISAVGRNLWYYAPNVPEYTNFDPEINGFGSTNLQGLDLSCAPTARKFAINLKVIF
jgi:TonB-linked SusC/RagA family outer membrane protein